MVVTVARTDIPLCWIKTGEQPGTKIGVETQKTADMRGDMRITHGNRVFPATSDDRIDDVATGNVTPHGISHQLVIKTVADGAFEQSLEVLIAQRTESRLIQDRYNTKSSRSSRLSSSPAL